MIEHNASKYSAFYTHSRPLGWGQKVKTFLFLKMAMLHIKVMEKSEEQHAIKIFDLMHIRTSGLGKKARH